MLDLISWRQNLRLSFSRSCYKVVVVKSKHFHDLDPGLSFGYDFCHFVALYLLQLIISLGQRLGAEVLVVLPFIVLRCIDCNMPVGFVNADFVFIVLLDISLESIRVYQYLICLRLIMILYYLHLNHLVFWRFFFGLSMVLNLFDNLARLRYTLRNLVRPFQAKTLHCHHWSR